MEKIDISKLFYDVLKPTFSVLLVAAATHMPYTEVKKVIKK